MRHALLSVVAAVIAGAGIAAQNPASSAAFEAASVKPNREIRDESYVQRQPGGRFNAVNFPLRALITYAYQLQGFQLAGAPGWIADERFDIVARLNGDPAIVLPGSGPDAYQLALQALLSDRFRLRVHRETRELDIYTLVKARPDGAPGPALRPSDGECEKIRARTLAGGAPPPIPANRVCGSRFGPGRIQFGGFPLSQFASGLSGQVGRFVVDRTGLTGNWDFELKFAPEQRGPLPPGVDLPPADPNAPSLFTAVQEQLGLKLEAARGPVEVLVVDSVERPVSD